MADETKRALPAGKPAPRNLGDAEQRIAELWDQLAPRRLPDAQLLRSVQKLIATMPPRHAFVERMPEIAAWVGAASAVLERWNTVRATPFRMSIENIGTALDFNNREYPAALAILHEARFDVELRGEAPSAAFVDKGKLHDYFEQVRELVAQAKLELLMTDRYLNAEFVERYIPFVSAGARVHLLVRRPEPTLLPAIVPAAAQFGLTIEVRT